jgi:hypothetical protein
MKRLRPLFVLALVLISTSSLVTPQQAEALICVCEPTIFTTPTAGASSSDCSTSQTALLGYLVSYAQGECGGPICNQQFVITDVCFQTGPTSYQVNGYFRYRCRVCG